MQQLHLQLLLIKFSTGVFGLINFTAVAASKTSLGYIDWNAHVTGSKTSLQQVL